VDDDEIPGGDGRAGPKFGRRPHHRVMATSLMSERNNRGRDKGREICSFRVIYAGPGAHCASSWGFARTKEVHMMSTKARCTRTGSSPRDRTRRRRSAVALRCSGRCCQPATEAHRTAPISSNFTDGLRYTWVMTSSCGPSCVHIDSSNGIGSDARFNGSTWSFRDFRASCSGLSRWDIGSRGTDLLISILEH